LSEWSTTATKKTNADTKTKTAEVSLPPADCPFPPELRVDLESA